MSVRISRALLAAILDEAAADPAIEACGLLFGAPDHVVEAQACRNVAADPARRFEIDPAALFAAIRAERGGGARLAGHYHSHPNGEASPSPRDAAMADQPGRLWLIVAGGQARCWRESPGGSIQGAFEPCSLNVEGGCA